MRRYYTRTTQYYTILYYTIFYYSIMSIRYYCSVLNALGPGGKSILRQCTHLGEVEDRRPETIRQT